MNLTKAAQISTKIILKVGEDTIEVWGFPYKVTDKFLSSYNDEKGNTPISKVLPLLVHDWNLERDIEGPAEVGGKGKKTEKVPITEKDIQADVPIWLQSEIFFAIMSYKSPNSKPSNL